MKADEVVKALRICLGDYTSNEDCEKCPYYLDDDSCACDRNPLNDAADLLEQLQAENEKLKTDLNRTIGLVELGTDELKRAVDDNGGCYGCIYLDLDEDRCTSEQGREMCDCKTNNMWEWKHQEELNELKRRVKE